MITQYEIFFLLQKSKKISLKKKKNLIDLKLNLVIDKFWSKFLKFYFYKLLISMIYFCISSRRKFKNCLTTKTGFHFYIYFQTR